MTRPDPDSPQPDIRDFIDGQSVFYAGTANTVMQLGWPGVGYGVYESKVDSGSVMKVPKKRLRTTVTYLSVALMGSEAERADYRAAVNGQHRQVRSGPNSPVKYNAFDSDLQLWVAACLYYGAEDFYERLHGPLDDDLKDWLYHQCSRLGTTLQVRADQWPEDRAAFEVMWKDGLTKVHYDDTIKAYLNGLLDLAQLPPRQRKRLGPFHRWVNTGFLPAEFREAMGLEWSAADEAKHARKMRRTGEKNRKRPRWLRNFPYNYFLLDFRVRRALRRKLV
jgi:uncharacterized protein (DUF2236 family)